MKKEEALAMIEEYFQMHSLLGSEENISFKAIKRNQKIQKPKLTLVPQPLPESLEDLARNLESFEGCGLKRFAKNTVFGEGVSNPKFLIIGEAPGEEEDLNGVPFCGRSGRLLTAALERFGISRKKNAYITNSVFWRPPANRKPESAELEACRPFLEKIISILKPELIIAIGGIAMQNAICKDVGFANLRKQVKDFEFKYEENISVKVITLYHPSYLLRSPSKKRDFYLDMIHFKQGGIL